MAILESGLAFWNPIIWIFAFIIVLAVAYFFRSRGQKEYKKGTAQTQVFLSGEEPPKEEEISFLNIIILDLSHVVETDRPSHTLA